MEFAGILQPGCGSISYAVLEDCCQKLKCNPAFLFLSVNRESLNSGNPKVHKQDEPLWKPMKLTGPGQGEVSMEFCLSIFYAKSMHAILEIVILVDIASHLPI